MSVSAVPIEAQARSLRVFTEIRAQALSCGSHPFRYWLLTARQEELSVVRRRVRSATSASTRSAGRTCLPQTSRSRKTSESPSDTRRSEEHTSELQSQSNLVCRLLLEKKNYMYLYKHSN